LLPPPCIDTFAVNVKLRAPASMPFRDHHSQLSRARASSFCGIIATLLVCSLCTVILSGYLQVSEHDRLHEKHRDHTARICMPGGTGAHPAVAMPSQHLCCKAASQSESLLRIVVQPSRGSSPHAYASEANSGRHLLRGGLSAARVAYLDKLHHVRLLAPLMPLI